MKFCKKCNCETDRYKSGGCKPCEYARSVKWRAANQDKVKEYCSTYRAANQEKERLRMAAWRAANPEKVRKCFEAWEAANPDKAKARKVAYIEANPDRVKASKKAWNGANPEKVKSQRSEWKKLNPETVRVHRENRRARKLASGGKLSNGIASRLFKLQRGKCACGCRQPLSDDYHLDHIMPLALGGTNTDDNIQLLRSTCNHQKHAKHPVDFMQQRGFLL